MSGQEFLSVDEHLLQVCGKIYKLQKDGIFCDIKLIVGDKSFHAHKAVLAACSDFFMAMFSSGFRESHQAEASVTGKSEAFEVLLECAYTGKLLLTMEIVMDVLQMAHYLQFNYAIQRCSAFLATEVSNQRVDIVAAIKIMITADVYNLDSLKEGSKQLITKNFGISDGFIHHMTSELMLEILKQNDLPIDEKQVFDTTLAWLQHDWDKRKEHAPVLLQQIRLGMVPLGYLSMTALRSADLYGIPECKTMIDNVFTMFDAKKPADAPLCYSYPNVFASRTTLSTFLGIGDSATMYYEPQTRTWIKLRNFPKMPEKDCPFTQDSSVVAQGQLYVSRGTDALGVINRKLKKPQFLMLDVAEKKWRILSPMKQRRPLRLPLLYHDGKIYAVSGDHHGSSCEAFTISDNSWQSIASMPYSCFNCSAGPMGGVVYMGKILVYGSVRNYPTTEVARHTLQRYDPVTNRWTQLLIRKHLALYSGLIVHNEQLYCVVNSDCKCEVDDCRWHGISVDQIAFDNTTQTALIGELQSQGPIPDSFKKKAFCIKEAVYIAYGDTFHKTDIKVVNNQVDKDKLEMYTTSFNNFDINVAMEHFTFDKAKWL